MRDSKERNTKHKIGFNHYRRAVYANDIQCTHKTYNVH